MDKKAKQVAPNECLGCKRVMPFAQLVHFPRAFATTIVDIGPLCTDCWERERYHHVSRTRITWREASAIVLVHLAVVYVLLFFTPPEIRFAYVGLWYVAILIFILFLVVLAKTKHDPALIPVNGKELAWKMPDPEKNTCLYHPHVNAVGACPYCGAPYCRLCLLFPALKTNYSRIKSRDITAKADAFASNVSKRSYDWGVKPTVEWYTSVYANYVSPETDLSDRTRINMFEARKKALPPRFTKFYTPAVDFAVDAIITGKPFDQNVPPASFLTCLEHAFGRNVMASRREKSTRAIFVALLLITIPLLINIIVGIGLDSLFVPTVVCIVFILMLCILSRPPMDVTITRPENEINKDIDNFLLFLDNMLGARISGEIPKER
ncbi:MAG: hypothetical protein Q6365_017020 [Candidatus Sigynarchaeota archaeon]